jgi:8-oxo-dGTP diphosphatase
VNSDTYRNRQGPVDFSVAVTLGGVQQTLLGVTVTPSQPYNQDMSSSKSTEKRRYTYDWPMAALTVDGIVFGFDPNDYENPLKVLLIRRGEEPFKAHWAIPGGHVNIGDDESLEDAVRREVKEETGALFEYLEQLYTFADPHRDPRGRVISVAYFALVRKADYENVVGGDDADAARWMPVRWLGHTLLAFDHQKILEMALNRLQAKIRYAPIGFNLLPSTFTLGQLQQLYEAILQDKLDKRNFRRRILAMGVLADTNSTTKGFGRPAKLYRFDKRRYEKAVESGFNFEV